MINYLDGVANAAASARLLGDEFCVEHLGSHVPHLLGRLDANVHTALEPVVKGAQATTSRENLRSRQRHVSPPFAPETSGGREPLSQVVNRNRGKGQNEGMQPGP